MQSLPSSGSRITSQLRSTSNPLVQRFLGGSGPTASVQMPVSVPVPAPVPEAATLPSSTNDQLALLENILAEVEATPPDQSTPLAQVLPQVLNQAIDTLNAPHPAGSARMPEQRASATAEIAPELAGHMQAVEQEPSPELSPEVEGYIEAVEHHAEQQPEEIVIADGSLPTQHSALPVKKVVVLPITEEETKAARLKNTTWSIKWLVSWTERLIKMFQGSVVYRSPE
ncbi:MAG: hypothetical protein O2840_04510 [bacterium]|nr:hypothetical protein [bacterium]